jgi:hypothetical protein
MSSEIDKYPLSEFDVDVDERKVMHRPSGIWFSFYEYPNEDDWKQSDSVMFHDQPRWRGHRQELARAAKRAALAKGMKASRPSR